MFRNLIIIFFLAACAGTQFEGAPRQRSADDQKEKSDKKANEPKPEATRELPAPADEPAAPADPGSSDDHDQTEDSALGEDGETQDADPQLGEDGEEIARRAKPDYAACSALPLAGLRSYGECGEGQGVVVVNDGLTPQMTCCPLGKDVLSSEAAKRHQPRTGKCQDGEVLTGMHDAKSGTGLCTALNSKLKIKSLKPSIYSKGVLVALEMALIAASYNASDTCICPVGSIAVGGHSASDNVCTEQCAEIGPK